MATHKDISDAPTKGGVTVPTTHKVKNDVMDNYFRSYEMSYAIKQGYLPTNDQIFTYLDKIKKFDFEGGKDLSQEGEAALAKYRDLLSALKSYIQSKNHDEIFQNFVFDASKTSVNTASTNIKTAGDSGDFATHGKALLKLVASNGEFRKLLSDAQIILRDIAGDAATSAGSRVKPSEEALAQVDSEAGAGTHEAPVPTDSGELEEAKGKFDKDAARDRARQERDKAQSYIQSKFPAERRDKYIGRLKKMVAELQGEPEYDAAMQFFLGQYKHYTSELQSAGKEQGAALNGSRNTSAETQFKTIVERLAGNTSVDPILKTLRGIYDKAQSDGELKSWLDSLEKFLDAVVFKKGYVVSDNATDDAKNLQETGKKFWDPKEGRYAEDKEALFGHARALVDGFANDKDNNALFGRFNGLVRALLFSDGEEGGLTLKTGLLGDAGGVILPQILRFVGYVPVPRIEYIDSSIEAAIENLTLDLPNLLPNVFELNARNHFRLSPQARIRSQTHHEWVLSFEQVQTDLRDVAFYFRKKTGFLKLKDHGLVDIAITGKGLHGTVHLTSTDDDNVFKVQKANVKIDNLRLKIKKNTHRFLASMANATASTVLKSALAKAVEVQLKDQLINLNEELSAYKKEFDEHAEGKSKTEAAKATYQSRKERTAKAKKESADKESPVQIVTRYEDCKIKWTPDENSSLKRRQEIEQRVGGKATKSWKSPAFSLNGRGSGAGGGTAATDTGFSSAKSKISTDEKTFVDAPASPSLPVNVNGDDAVLSKAVQNKLNE